MKKILILLLLVWSVSTPAENVTALARYAITNEGQNTVRFLDLSWSQDDWLLALNITDLGSSKYREIGAGAGKIWIREKSVFGTVVYLMTTTGSQSLQNEWYLQPYLFTSMQISKKFRFVGNVTPYLPISDSAVQQTLVGKLALEYEFGSMFTGLGYSGYQYKKTDWDHAPFVSLGIKDQKIGNPEIWIQHLLSEGYQIQLRLSLIF